MKFPTKSLILSFILSLGYPPIEASGEYGIVEVENPGSTPLEVQKQYANISTVEHLLTPRYIQKQSMKSKQKATTDGDKIIYLTFDDGPIRRGTRNVANVLRDEGVSGTMFFIGKHIQKHRRLYRSIASMHNLLIANHTYSHANGKYAKFYSMRSKAVLQDINRAQNRTGGTKYLRLAGRNVWRLPHVYRNDYSLSKYRRSIEKPKYNTLSDNGYQIFGWDIEWHYNSKGEPRYSERQMFNRIEAMHKRHHTATKGKLVLLAHDFMFRSRKQKSQLKHLIALLRKNGWQFASLASYNDAAVGAPIKAPEQMDKPNVHLVSAETNSTMNAEQTLKAQLRQTPLQKNKPKATEG